MATLYKLQESYAQIQQMIEEGTKGLEDTLQSIEGALEEKLESYAMVIKNIESDVEGLKSEEKRLSERRKSLENGIKRMKLNMHDAMLSTGERKIKGDKFTFTIQKNPPSLKVVDESLIPLAYVQVKEVRTVDKNEITDQLKLGVEIAGVEMFQGESIRIR